LGEVAPTNEGTQDHDVNRGRTMQTTPGYKLTDVGIIPNNWEVLRFGDQFNISAGGDFNPKLSSSEQDEVHCFPIYSNSLTDNGFYGYCSYAAHPAHSISITARGTLGVATYRNHRYTAIGRVLVLTPKKGISGQFFAEFINHRVQFAIESTGVPQLTAPQIASYRLAVPPLAEQTAIAEVLSDMDAELSALEARRDKTRDLKQGMMQELLTGRVRLVPAGGADA
jgi:type I restriction enzyme S subunit